MFRIDAAVEDGLVGFVFVNGPQFAAKQPHRGIEPLEAAREIGEQQIDRMAQTQMGLFVQDDRVAVFGQILL